MERTFRETWTQQTRNLLDEGFRRKERVVLLRELLNKLLVLVKPWEKKINTQMSKSYRSQTCKQNHSLLQVVNGHVLHVNLLGTIDVRCIRKDAHGHARAGQVGQPMNHERV